MRRTTSSSPLVIAVDFDGTIAFDSWPNAMYGKPNRMLIRFINWMKRKYNVHVALWTCRENYGGKMFADGEYLTEAIEFGLRHGLIIDSANLGYDEEFDDHLNHFTGRKLLAGFYIDDASCPLGMKRFRRLKWFLFIVMTWLSLGRFKRYKR